MEGKTIVGVDIGGTNIRVGKVLNNKIIDLYTQQITSKGSLQIVIDEIISSIYKIFDKSVLGIGVGIPSVVDVKKGIVYDTQNIPSFKKVKLQKILEDRFKVRSYINNDANCFAVGEKYFGVGKNYDDLVGLIIGTGLGAGVYTSGKLYLGANCGAGEFGMLPYLDGLYEDYCSGKYFTNKLQRPGESIFLNAEKGDKEAIKIFNKFGAHVGNAICTIMLTVDPEIVILGGSVSKAFKYFKASMEEVLKKFPYQNSARRLKVERSMLEHVSVLGAAALYFENHVTISNKLGFV